MFAERQSLFQLYDQAIRESREPDQTFVVLIGATGEPPDHVSAHLSAGSAIAAVIAAARAIDDAATDYDAAKAVLTDVNRWVVLRQTPLLD